MPRWQPTLLLLLLLLLPALILLHLSLSPYTKVEESFNIQAVHDILSSGIPRPSSTNASEQFTCDYDHASFPGAVPRTFIGALVLAGIVTPLLQLGFGSPAAATGLLGRQFLGQSKNILLPFSSRELRE
jgi:hypothetical protein